MASITAVLHTKNDARRLGRCLETLYPCDQILILDQSSVDGTVSIARHYGAKIITVSSETSPPSFLRPLASEWILALDPHESLSESLAASIFHWKTQWTLGEPDAAFAVFLREETGERWVENPVAQTRLVPSTWTRWRGILPLHEPSAQTLDGVLLRFTFP